MLSHNSRTCATSMAQIALLGTFYATSSLFLFGEDWIAFCEIHIEIPKLVFLGDAALWPGRDTWWKALIRWVCLQLQDVGTDFHICRSYAYDLHMFFAYVMHMFVSITMSIIEKCLGAHCWKGLLDPIVHLTLATPAETILFPSLYHHNVWSCHFKACC